MASQVQAASRKVSVGELNLHYLEWGIPSSPALVMAHGLSGTAHNFDALAPRLAGRYHVIAPDMRGRGGSDWAVDGDYTNDAYVRDLEGLRTALGIARMSLIGTSMGGRISLAYAGTYPERVERLVVSDIGPELDPRGAQRIDRLHTTAPLGFPNMGGALAWYREHYPRVKGFSDADVLQILSPLTKQTPDGKVVWTMDPELRKDTRRPDPMLMWELSRKVAAPVLLFRGSETDILPIQVAERMVQEIPNCRLVEVSGVGHAPTMLEPEAWSALQGFLGLE